MEIFILKKWNSILNNYMPVCDHKMLWSDLNKLHAYIANQQDVEYLDIRKNEQNGWLVYYGGQPEYFIKQTIVN